MSWDEWMAGLDFLARVGHWTSEARNEFILYFDVTYDLVLVPADWATTGSPQGADR